MTRSTVGANHGEADSIEQRVKDRKGNEEEFGGTSSSGSSNLKDVPTPSGEDNDEDEKTALLGITRRGRRRRSFLLLFRSFLMYQPRSIRLLNKVLPFNGISIVVLALLGLNICYSFLHINFTIFELFVWADRFGLLFVPNLPLLYLLAAKNQPLKVLTGCSYEFLNIFHRRLGEILCLQAFLHCVGMICVWYTLLRLNDLGFISLLLHPVILIGIEAFSFEILYFTSLGSFCQRWYELFLGLHVVLQTAALVFVFFHHSAARPYVGVALSIFLIDRLVYRLGLKSTTVKADVMIMEDGEIVKLSTQIIKKPLRATFQMFRRCIKDGWQATDHVITVPCLGYPHILQSHPFTIASAASLEGGDQHRLEVLIRAQNGLSRDLLKKARLRSHLQMRIDGLYGSSHARDMLEASDLAILVA